MLSNQSDSAGDKIYLTKNWYITPTSPFRIMFDRVLQAPDGKVEHTPTWVRFTRSAEAAMLTPDEQEKLKDLRVIYGGDTTKVSFWASIAVAKMFPAVLDHVTDDIKARILEAIRAQSTDDRNQAGHDGTGANLATNASSTATGLSIIDSEGKTRNYTREQVNLLKNMIARGATDDQLKVFLYVANKRGLDPFLRQIYFSLRRARNSSGDWESAPTIITGIDGFRVIADRTKQYDGIERQIMKDREGNELIYRDPRFGIDLPLGAWAVVYRKDRSHPFRVEVFTSEYLQTHKNNKGDVVLDEQWAKQPRNMIMKVAEAACLRMAFPEDLGGLYSSDEVSDGNPLIDQGDAN